MDAGSSGGDTGVSEARGSDAGVSDADDGALGGIRAEAWAVFRLLLRARGGTLADLADITTRPLEGVCADVAELVRAGLVTIAPDGATVRAHPPAAALCELVAAELGEAALAYRRARRLLTALPELDAFWEAGAATGDDAPATLQVLHGPQEISQEWWRLHRLEQPTEVAAVFTHPRLLEEFVADDVDPLRERLAAGLRMRALVGVDVVEREASAGVVRRMAEAGIDVRLGHDVPSWAHLMGSRLAAVPLEWGMSMPGSIIVLREPALVGAVRALYESWWAAAAPLPERFGGTVPDHDTTFAMLAQGLSDEAVARALGVSVRTVRRRVALAMDRLGARSRFELAHLMARSAVRGDDV